MEGHRDPGVWEGIPEGSWGTPGLVVACEAGMLGSLRESLLLVDSDLQGLTSVLGLRGWDYFPCAVALLSFPCLFDCWRQVGSLDMGMSAQC